MTTTAPSRATPPAPAGTVDYRRWQDSTNDPGGVDVTLAGTGATHAFDNLPAGAHGWAYACRDCGATVTDNRGQHTNLLRHAAWHIQVDPSTTIAAQKGAH